MKKISLKKNKKKGFTLIETLIAITILMISVAAPLSLASKGLQAANLAKNQIVAYYLAQDAYEWVKNKTDMNKAMLKTYAENGIVNGFDKCINNSCIIDTIKSPTDSSAIKRYTGQFLKKNNSTKIYSYSSGNNSIFKRYVKIDKVRDDGSSIDEVSVKVTVEWNVPYTGTQKYVLTGHISNW